MNVFDSKIEKKIKNASQLPDLIENSPFMYENDHKLVLESHFVSYDMKFSNLIRLIIFFYLIIIIMYIK